MIQLSHNIPISQENMKNLLSKHTFSIFKLFIDIQKYCDKITMTRETIANRVGCSVKTVSRATRRLNELGLIRKNRKWIGRTKEKCTYKVYSQYLGLFKKQVNKFMNAGLKFPVRILRSAVDKIKNVPVVNLSLNNIYIKDYIKESYSKRETVSVAKRIKKESSKGWKVTYPVKSEKIERPYISTMDKIKSEQQQLSWVEPEPEVIKDPYEEIKKGIKWMESPEGQRFARLLGHQISPDLKWALEQKEVPSEVKEMLFNNYPFLRSYFKEDK